MIHATRAIASLALFAALTTLCLAQSPAPSSPPARTSRSLPAAMPEPETRAQFSLLHASGIVQPDTTTTLALHFTLDDHWHLYYNGLAEEGMEPRWELMLPTGWQAAGEPAWPAPTRKHANELTVEHIYERSLTLLLPISIPADAPLGPATITASAKWIVCNDACLSESADSTLRLRVVADAASSIDPEPPPPNDSKEPRHIIARAARAAALPGLDSPQAAKLGLRVALADAPATLTLEASGQVAGLAFFPAQGTSPFETDPENWSVDATRLRLEFAPLDHPAPAPPLPTDSTNTPPTLPPIQARGILEVRLRNPTPNAREYFRLEVQSPDPQSNLQSSPQPK